MRVENASPVAVHREESLHCRTVIQNNSLCSDSINQLCGYDLDFLGLEYNHFTAKPLAMEWDNSVIDGYRA